MSVVRSVLVAAVLLGIVAASGEGWAVIYKIVNEKGDPVYVDDLSKVPEQDRGRAVIVSGQDEHELLDDADRAKALEARQAGAELALEQAPEPEPFSHRLIRSGIAVLGVVAVLFVVANIDALKEKEKLIRNIRVVLISAVVVFLGITHAKDMAGLFGHVGRTVAEPISGVQEKQASRGRQAAESYKSMDRVLQNAQENMEQMQKQFDEAEQGK